MRRRAIGCHEVDLAWRLCETRNSTHFYPHPGKADAHAQHHLFTVFAALHLVAAQPRGIDTGNTSVALPEFAVITSIADRELAKLREAKVDDLLRNGSAALGAAPDEGGEDGPVGPVQARPRVGSAEHHDS
jgi:hypothetical protein